MDYKLSKHKEVNDLLAFFTKDTIEFCIKNNIILTFQDVDHISNLRAFIGSHLDTVSSHYPNPVYMPYYSRIKQYMNFLMINYGLDAIKRG